MINAYIDKSSNTNVIQSEYKQSLYWQVSFM